MLSSAISIVLTAAVTATVTYASKKILNVAGNSLAYVSILTFLLMSLLAIWNINIALPDEVYQAITSERVEEVFYSVGFFIPIGFILKCLACLIFSRYFGFMLHVVSKIYIHTYHILSGIVSGDSK